MIIKQTEQQIHFAKTRSMPIDAKKLMNARVRAGLSQCKLGRKLNVAQSLISRWESDGYTQHPSVFQVVDLCRELGISSIWDLIIDPNPALMQDFYKYLKIILTLSEPIDDTD